MSISIQRGAASAALGLAGTGAVVIWPDQWLIGILLIVAGAIVFLSGIRIGDRHWWALRPKIRNPFRRGGSLYTGRINVSDGELDTKHFFEVSVTAFNGTAHTFQTASIEGTVHVEFILGGSGKGGFDLRAPILYMESPKPHDPDKEFILGSRLFLDAGQVSEYRSRLASGHSVQLMLSGLKVVLETKRGKRATLPLWDGVGISQGGLMANRIVCIVAHAAISGNASLG